MIGRRRRETQDIVARLARSSGLEADALVETLLADVPPDAPSGVRPELMAGSVAWLRGRLAGGGERDRTQRLEAALRAYGRLTPAGRERFRLALGGRCRSFLVERAASPFWALRHAVCAVSLDLAQTPTGPLLIPSVASLIADEDERVAQAAGGALVRMAAAASLPGAASGAQLERAAAAVRAAADAYPAHRNLDAVGAMLAISSLAVRAGAAGERAAAWISDADDAVLLAARSALRGLPGEIAVRRAIELAAVPGLARPAAELLREHREAAATGALAAGDLLRRPRRRAALRTRLGALSVPLPTDDQTGTPSGATGWLRSGLLASADESALAERMLASEQPIDRVRLGVVGDDASLRDLVFDAEPRVAEHAVMRVAVLGSRSLDAPAGFEGVGLRARRAPHASVRRLAERVL
ncbi:MAG: hypothetical protein AAGF47_10230, partial [Planctomycetota bacterium]